MKVFASVLLVSSASAFSVGAIGNMRGGAVTMSASGKVVSTSSPFHSFEVEKLDGSTTDLSAYKGKPTLICNVASLWGTTVRDFTDMNALVDKFGDDIAVLGFPSNQFGHQTNEGNDEFLNTLKYVRPGDGFEPKCDVFGKCAVNGAEAIPLFKWLKSSMMIPSDPKGDTKENGVDDIDALILPRGGFDATTISLWSPVARSDIAWNFEKFLVDGEGKPIKRYSRYWLIPDIAADIEALLEEAKVAA